MSTTPPPTPQVPPNTAASTPLTGLRAPAAPLQPSDILTSLPSGLTTSEGKLTFSITGVIILALAIFDVLLAASAFPNLPQWVVPSVHGIGGLVIAYITNGYAQARSNVKAAALTAASTTTGGQ